MTAAFEVTGGAEAAGGGGAPEVEPLPPELVASLGLTAVADPATAVAGDPDYTG
jgi:hypothetical protein